MKLIAGVVVVIVAVVIVVMAVVVVVALVIVVVGGLSGRSLPTLYVVISRGRILSSCDD